MKVYLAGKMGGRLGQDVLTERFRAVQACHENSLTPIDPAMSEFIAPDKAVDLNMDYATMRSYVEKDEFAIRHCDALLVLTGDTPSEGTGCEIELAHTLNIPIVLVAPRRVKYGLMGFWNIKAAAMFETVEEAAEYLAENYGEVLHAIR